MKKLVMMLLSLFCAASVFAQATPTWVSPDSSMMIIEGSGPGWTYGGGTWTPAGQTWMGAGEVNNPPVSSAWAQLDLSSFAGDSAYVYVMWHKNGPYRPHAAHFEIYDAAGVQDSVVVDETKQANGEDLTNDAFSGWYLIGKKRIAITSTTKLRMFKDSTATSSEYMQSDAVLLSKYPVIDNTSLGSVDSFQTMLPLSVSDTGPTGIGSHWGKQGLSEQFTTTAGDSAYAQLDSSDYPDVPAGYYHVDVSWVYYNTNNLNVTGAQYSVNDTLVADTINQNLSATNQGGTFVAGNSVGTWSEFYRLSGTYYYSPSHPLKVGLAYNAWYSGQLVWNMVRFEPAPAPPVKMAAKPSWVSPDSSMMIIEGGGPGWTFGGGTWTPPPSQTWMQKGEVNNPPVNSAWAQLDLSSFAGDSVYVYVVWHVNGPWRGHAIHYQISNSTGVLFSTVVNETEHADTLALMNDTFSGWYLLGNKKVVITPSTDLRIFKDSTATSSEYMQSDAVLLSKYPVIDNTSMGSVDNFPYMLALTVPDTGATGIGSHWGKQGLSEQFTYNPGDSAYAQLDTTVYKDVPSGYYHVDVSWVYYNYDSVNVMNALYSVNGTTAPDTLNQNLSATNQAGPFVEGNSIGTWSGFYQLHGSYYYSQSHPLRVSTYYDGSRYLGYSLVWNMVRFVPTSNSGTGVTTNQDQVPTEYRLYQNYPNPFNPSTVIQYALPKASKVVVQVYDVLGRVVETLVSGRQAAGTYKVVFNADRFASGVYFVRLVAGDYVRTVKMMLLK